MKEEALKLADELKNDANNFKQGFMYSSRYIEDIADMIRKLVAENDNLFKALIAEQEHNEKLVAELDRVTKSHVELEKGILAELDKQGELVAWWDGKHFASKEKSSLADIPLYTAPQTKPLSDEEIYEIYSKFDVTIPMGAWLFARAILKKASEK